MINLSTFSLLKQVKNIEGAIELDTAMLHKLHQCLLTILDDIMLVCKKYSIKYMLSYGSALGAVRHKGFIPWDDDIDINMERKEFDRFVLCLQKEFSDKYWIQDPSDATDHSLMIGRISLKNTSYRLRKDDTNPVNGVFIDFFIIDNTFDNVVLRTLHGVGCLAFGLLLSCRRFFHDRKYLATILNRDPETRKIFRIKMAIGFVVAFLTTAQWRRLTNLWYGLCKKSSSRYVSIPGGSEHFFGSLYRRDHLCTTVDMAFEGRMVPVMKGYDEYLTRSYGNYLWIPPEDQREKHILFELKC